VQITHVVETHLHNDYVSGGLEPARLTGATYAAAAADDVDFDRRGLLDGDTLHVSPRLELRVLGTPGHTFHHLSYVLQGPDGAEGVALSALRGPGVTG
jgi:hydroxyacylglutathione hydrolase